MKKGKNRLLNSLILLVGIAGVFNGMALWREKGLSLALFSLLLGAGLLLYSAFNIVKSVREKGKKTEAEKPAANVDSRQVSMTPQEAPREKQPSREEKPLPARVNFVKWTFFPPKPYPFRGYLTLGIADFRPFMRWELEEDGGTHGDYAGGDTIDLPDELWKDLTRESLLAWMHQTLPTFPPDDADLMPWDAVENDPRLDGWIETVPQVVMQEKKQAEALREYFTAHISSDPKILNRLRFMPNGIYARDCDWGPYPQIDRRPDGQEWRVQAYVDTSRGPMLIKNGLSQDEAMKELVRLVSAYVNKEKAKKKEKEEETPSDPPRLMSMESKLWGENQDKRKIVSLKFDRGDDIDDRIAILSMIDQREHPITHIHADELHDMYQEYKSSGYASLEQLQLTADADAWRELMIDHFSGQLKGDEGTLIPFGIDDDTLWFKLPPDHDVALRDGVIRVVKSNEPTEQEA